MRQACTEQEFRKKKVDPSKSVISLYLLLLAELLYNIKDPHLYNGNISIARMYIITRVWKYFSYYNSSSLSIFIILKSPFEVNQNSYIKSNAYYVLRKTQVSHFKMVSESILNPLSR